MNDWINGTRNARYRERSVQLPAVAMLMSSRRGEAPQDATCQVTVCPSVLVRVVRSFCALGMRWHRPSSGWRRLVWVVLIPLMVAACSSVRRPVTAGVMDGTFMDDYANTFAISRTRFDQQPHGRFHLVEWHVDSQYVIAQNDAGNSSDGGAWTRIDWMPLDMAPYTWAFCFTAWKAPSREAARSTPAADRAHPRTGCNGRPFSRMRPHR